MYEQFVAHKLEENKMELAYIRLAAAMCVEMELREDPGSDFRTGKSYGRPASIPIEGAAMRRICKLLMNNTRAICLLRKICQDYPSFAHASLTILTANDEYVSLDPFSVCSETTAANPGHATHYKIAMPDDCYKRFRASLSLRKLRRLQKFESPEKEEEYTHENEEIRRIYGIPGRRR